MMIGGGGDLVFLPGVRVEVVVTLEVLDRRVLGLAGGLVRVISRSVALEVSGGGGSLGGEKVRSDGIGVGGKCVEDRIPRVEGKVMAAGSSVESMYIVRARGGGAIKSFRSRIV